MFNMKKDKFIYGVSTSAFQIEGDDGTQGRGRSVWDDFCDIKGKIYNGQNGKIAADHYNRMEKDVKLIKELGCNSYRFSVSWSRLLPEGTGKINQKGIDFYDRLIDNLLTNGIEPMLTAYHWDLPSALHKKGGFLSEDFPCWFEEYANLISKNYGNRVNKYITFNEPINIISSGYYKGIFAPGYRYSEVDAARCLVNMHVAHFKSAHIFSENAKNAQISMAMSTFGEFPMIESAENIDVARKRFFEKEELFESVDVYLDPLYRGKYPKRFYERVPQAGEYAEKFDFKKYLGNTNFIALNNYGGNAVRADGSESNQCEFNSVRPKSLFWSIKFLIDRYNLPLYITENGVESEDELLGKRVNDELRVCCIKENLNVVEAMIKQGFDIRGYFVWSFLDNFEWLDGYSRRFGIVYVDYSTLERIPKNSFYYYRERIKKNRILI